ncbi:synaptotagmin-3 isoform X3 [Gossypium raimondii]|uniref:synaptotagmin-3 isoform X3 n=1 Tax=Gossypium raimondii TaxID=29730 RepID=UPI00227B62F9|nr:synaptotagmin-3 isoform X3 [Gossypium raimondii]
MGWQSKYSFGGQSVDFPNHNSGCRYANTCGPKGNFETSCSNHTMFCKCFSLSAEKTRDRLRIECSWRGSYVHTRSLSYYPGAVPRTIKMQIASLYLWPQSLEIPILDPSTVAINKPVGILHVKVVRAHKLLKMDFLGTSDPYVKLNLTGESLPAKKTSIKKRNLNPVWNEKFKLVVKDPESQVLQLEVFDWDKVGTHDRLGMQFVPLKLLTANETKEFKLDLLKHTFIADPYDKKPRGNIVIELTYAPFREESIKVDGIGDVLSRKESSLDRPSLNSSEVLSGAGLLSVTVQGAEDVEGLRHNNPYAVIRFRGDKKKTKKIKKTRHPLWNEEFQFMLEEPPLNDTIRIQVMSRRKGIGFHSKECLGKLDINLTDVVHNGRINTKYHLLNSKNGKIHVDIKWTIV